MTDFFLQPRALEPWDRILLLCFLGVFAVSAFLTWRRGGPARRRAGMILFRLGSLALLTVIFFQPVWQRRVRLENVPLAVVLDGSESMAVADAGAEGRERRWDAALARLSRHREWLEEDFSPVYYRLDKSARAVSWEELVAATPRGAVSDLSRLEDVHRQNPQTRAVVVLSDGRKGGGRDPVPRLARLGVPLYAVGVGRDETAPDLVLDSVRAPHFAFKDTEVEVTVRVEKQRLALTKTLVKVLQEGRAVAAKTVEFSTANAAEATLSFFPSTVGRQAYEAVVPGYAGESNTRNNRRAFALEVSRSRIRVLYISGRPGPHYAFLRHQLKNNPSVELVSFVILRDPEDVVAVPDQELALIPFPGPDVLFGQLRSFDVIVLEQFGFSTFGVPASGLAPLREYVERGGGLLMMGDEALLGPQSPYRGSAVEDILPLRLDAPLANGPRRFALEAREPGHPVMALAEGEEASREVWGRLPELEGGGVFAGAARPGALVLAGCRAPEGAFPVLAVWKRGRGRVASFASLSSWRWALGEAGRGHGPWTYQKFWNNFLAWLSASEDMGLVRLSLPQEASPAGTEALLEASVRDENHRPLSSAQVEAVVWGPDGERRHKVLRSLGEGEYAESVPLEEPGRYRVLVQAFHRQKKLGQDEGTLQVGQEWDENRDTRTDFPFLRRLAEATGGEFVALEDFSADWLEERLKSVGWTYERREGFWNSPWMLALLVSLLMGEWFARRRWGGV